MSPAAWKATHTSNHCKTAVTSQTTGRASTAKKLFIKFNPGSKAAEKPKPSENSHEKSADNKETSDNDLDTRIDGKQQAVDACKQSNSDVERKEAEILKHIRIQNIYLSLCEATATCYSEVTAVCYSESQLPHYINSNLSLSECRGSDSSKS